MTNMLGIMRIKGQTVLSRVGHIQLEMTLCCLFPPQSWTHNISKEKEFLRKLVKANIITDLTYGI